MPRTFGRHLRPAGVLLLVGLLHASPFAIAAEPTTLLIVRHAEKATGDTDDVSLTPAGRERAELLRGIVAPLRVEAIYVTAKRRAHETAQPAAAALDIEPKEYDPAANGWAQKLVESNAGKTLLVIGHSDTIPSMLAALTGQRMRIPQNKFDDLFIVTIDDRGPTLVRLHYGKPTD